MTDRNGFENPYARTLRTGDESWVLPCLKDRRPAIGVQWLTFQGVEFHVLFDGAAERDAAARRLFDALAPESERAIRGRSKFDLATEAGHPAGSGDWHAFLRDVEYRQVRAAKGEFTVTDRTITPDAVAEVLGSDARFAITPTSHNARRELEKLGIDVWFKAELAMTGAEVLEALEQVAPAGPRP